MAYVEKKVIENILKKVQELEEGAIERDTSPKSEEGYHTFSRGYWAGASYVLNYILELEEV